MKVNIKKTIICSIYFLIFISILCRMLSKAISVSALNRLSYMGLMGVIGFSIIYIFLDIITKKRKTNKFNFFLFIIIVYELVVSIINENMYFPYTIIDIVTWPLMIMVFSNYTESYDVPRFIKKRLFFDYSIIFFISLILISIHLSGKGNYGEVIFPAYYCLTFLPIILYFHKNVKIKKISIILCLIILIASTKRTGTIAAVGGIFLYFFIDIKISKSKTMKVKKYKVLIAIIFIAMITIFIGINNGKSGVIERLGNISVDGGSGRDLIWTDVIQNFNSSSTIEKIFGHGYQSVYYQLKPLGFYRLAHNSYIEYLYDYGYIGLILIIIFFLSIIRFSFKMLKNKNECAPALFYSLIVTGLLSIFSYFFEQSAIILPFAILWGCCLGEVKRKELKNVKIKTFKATKFNNNKTFD